MGPYGSTWSHTIPIRFLVLPNYYDIICNALVSGAPGMGLDVDPSET